MSQKQRPEATAACQAYSPKVPNPYGYKPELIVGIIFCSLFGVSTIVHIIQALTIRIRGRRVYWLWGYVLGAFAECAGWLARIISSQCAYSVMMFKMQLAILVMAPSFTMAGVYAIIYVLVPILGYHTMPFSIKLKWYLVGCIMIDLVCLALQGTGGGLAGAAFSKKKDTALGTNTMIVGIVIQLASIILFDCLFTIIMYRGWQTIRNTRPLWILCAATKLVVSCMVIRAIYRTMELVQGWRGYLITNERFAIGLEGAMMLTTVIVFNIFNPAKLLQRALNLIQERADISLTTYSADPSAENAVEK